VSHAEQIIPHGHVLRYALKERLTHWVAAGAYIYLLMTGLAFWSPWLFWVAVILGGAPVSRMLHPWAGLIFFAAVWNMLRHVGTADEANRCGQSMVGRGPLLQHQSRRQNAAGRALQRRTEVSLLGIFLEHRGAASERSRAVVPGTHPVESPLLENISVLVHPAAALFTIGLFLIHIYMGVFAERGAFGSVIRGDVSIAFAKRYHPGWYKEIVGDSSTPRK